MLNISRWAEVFLAVFGDAGGTAGSENAQEAYLCLKTLAVPVKSVKGVFYGANAAEKLEKILRESAAVSGNASNAVEPAASVEYAIRFLCLLVEKNCLKYLDSILSRIEHLLNEKNGILDITIEAAYPLEDDFTKELTQMIKEKTKAAGVNIKTSVKPELLGGYLLRTNGFFIDATLKEQADKMITELGNFTPQEIIYG